MRSRSNEDEFLVSQFAPKRGEDVFLEGEGQLDSSFGAIVPLSSERIGGKDGDGGFYRGGGGSSQGSQAEICIVVRRKLTSVLLFLFFAALLLIHPSAGREAADQRHRKFNEGKRIGKRGKLQKLLFSLHRDRQYPRDEVGPGSCPLEGLSYRRLPGVYLFLLFPAVDPQATRCEIWSCP